MSKKMEARVGTTLASIAAAIILTGPTVVPAAESAGDGFVKCYGVNACRGRGQCKNEQHKCKGVNSCKGIGWVPVAEGTCERLGGVQRDSET